MYTDPRPLEFPRDILRFLYWVFFKPMTLSNYMTQIDSSLPKYSNISLFTLWQRRREHPEFTPLIQLSFANIFFMPLLTFPLAGLLQLSGVEINWFNVMYGVTYGLAFGLTAGVAAGMAAGVAFGVTAGVAAGMAGGVATGMTLEVAYGVAVGIATGITLGVAGGVTLSMAGGMTAGIIISIAAGVSFVVRAGSITEGMITTMATGIAFILTYLRLPLYILQAPWALFHNHLYESGELTGSPLFWDEMIWFPLPGLDELLIKISKQDRQQGIDAISFVSNSFRQDWAVSRALSTLIMSDINKASSLKDVAKISLDQVWQKDTIRFNFQNDLEQISHHARAALESQTLYNRQEQLRLGIKLLDPLVKGLSESRLFHTAGPSIQSWLAVFIAEIEAAGLKENIPNVYVSSSPLIKESKVFKGRKDLFLLLTNELSSPAGQRASLLLFGARRMGKTSTLKQLPIQLGPQIVPVSIDLQQVGTVKNTENLLYLLARNVVRSAYEERRLKLPELERSELEKDPYFAFQEWLNNVENELDDYYWVLLALDEFEALGEMLESGRIDERIFQMIRGIIQHHPRFTVLMSGAHTLEELPPLWSNYLINTKMLKVGPLQEADARELILHPIPDFPLSYDEDAVELLLSETGCHPNWLQFTCREVVETLNNENRFHAVHADVKSALSKVPQVLAGDFKDLWEGRDSSDLMRNILRTIAVAKEDALPESELKKYFKPEVEYQNTREFLLRRDILVYENETYRFRANLLKRWVAAKT